MAGRQSFTATGLRTLAVVCLTMAIISSPVLSLTAGTPAAAHASCGALLCDTFARANSSSWGTASDGNAWTSLAGTTAPTDGANWGIVNNEGFLSQSPSSSFLALGAAPAQADTDATVRFQIATVGGADTLGILARAQDANNYYLLRYVETTGNFEFYKKVGGVSTTTTVYTVNLAVSTHYRLRFRLQGSTWSMKYWRDGSAEPASWTATGTDTSLPAAGYSGLYGFSQTSSSRVSFSDFTVADAGTPMPTATPTTTFTPTPKPTDTPTATNTALVPTPTESSSSVAIVLPPALATPAHSQAPLVLQDKQNLPITLHGLTPYVRGSVTLSLRAIATATPHNASRASGTSLSGLLNSTLAAMAPTYPAPAKPVGSHAQKKRFLVQVRVPFRADKHGVAHVKLPIGAAPTKEVRALMTVSVDLRARLISRSVIVTFMQRPSHRHWFGHHWGHHGPW